MGVLLFPDNTVLVNFGLLGRVDLFGELVDGRGAWTNAIAEECARSARQPGLEALARIPVLLGAPLMPTKSERIDTLALRQQMADPFDPPHRHLGEAEAITMIAARGIAAAFVTDDGGARREAAKHRIPLATTGDLLRLAVRVSKIDPGDGWDLVLELRRLGRKVPSMPGDRGHYDHWVVSTR